MKARRGRLLTKALCVGLVFQVWMPNVNAAETVLCNSCGFDQTLKVLLSQRSVGPFYVQDNDAKVTRYYEAQGPFNTPFEKPMPPDAARFWANAWQIYSANGNNFTVTIQVEFDADLPNPDKPVFRSLRYAERAADAVPSVPVDKFDAWWASRAGWHQDYVKQQLNNAPLTSPNGFWVKLSEKIGVTIPALAGFFGVGDPSHVKAAVVGSGAVVEVRFKDGSHMKFAWDPYQQSFEAVRHSAYDSSGNRIPIIPNDLLGPDKSDRTYNYPDTPQGRRDNELMWDRLNAWNISFPRKSGVIACSGVEGGTPRCSLF